ncbi:MAG: hybrid sensor histidine kinase/response regulator [Spirulina sp. SIO3F2]|nr:hybrid sensor histidine kinase/response regulator [Spirulina sp. SIO3F2]
MTKGKVLAVDDTPANLEVITETLGDAGYMVSTAIDGTRALNRVQNYQPDLILLDVMMPGMDGFETCQRIKADPVTANIPIIFITALADVENKVKGFSLGGVDYITKPFQEQEMLARVNAHLRLRQLNQNLEAQVLERTQKLEVALSQLQDFQLQLVQQEKMSALGNLVAGVAHEINNPLGAISGNAHEAKVAIAELIEHLQLYHNHQAENIIQDHAEEIDLDYLLDDIPKILNTISVSCDRIREISLALRLFSRQDHETKTEFDIHTGIDSTLLILKHRLKANEKRPEIELTKDYGKLPQVDCYPGQINQVFMNILANSIDAINCSIIAKSYQEIELKPNIITITTCVVDEYIEIQIQDNGCGMSNETAERIFEQGFTTKDVGKGTGLGMAIAHQIITEKHNGTIQCQSELEQGTTFIIRLPL